ncbi:MAG: response regulator, partial [Parashewanella sp.]
MVTKVLVVDDSSFFRRRVSEILAQDPRLEVVGTAINGAEAVKMAAQLRPNVITMDIEMPVMDGITAVKEIMGSQPTPILMFSSLTHDGAQATLDALDAGALDFLPKRFEDIATNRDQAIRLLQQKVKELGQRRLFKRTAVQPQTPSLTKKVESNPTPTRQPSTLRTATTSAQSEQVVAKNVTIKPSGKKYKAL